MATSPPHPVPTPAATQRSSGLASIRIGSGVKARNLAIGQNNTVIGTQIHITVAPPIRMAGPVHLPGRRTNPFLGRAAELSLVTGTSYLPSAQVVGAEGVGRSTFLRHASQSLLPSHGDGTVFLSLPGVPVSDWARALFDRFHTRVSTSRFTAVPTDADVRHALRSLRAFVLLDDLDAEPEAISQLLDYLPESRVVFSRDTPALADVHTIPLAGLAEDDALRLAAEFRRRASTWLGDEPLTPSYRAEVLATRGNPAAIGRAALRRVPAGFGSPPAKESSVLFNLGELMDLPENTSEGALSVLRVLYVSGGGWVTLETLAAVTSKLMKGSSTSTSGDDRSTRALLEELVEKGIVTCDDSDRPRYRLGRRGRERLQHDRAVVAAVVALLAHFIRAAANTAANESGAFLGAISFAANNGCHEEVLACVHAVEPHLLAGGAIGTSSAALEHHVAAARALGDATELGWGLHEQGVVELLTGNPSPARILLNEALKIRRAHGEPEAIAMTRMTLQIAGRPAVGWVATAVMLALLFTGGAAGSVLVGPGPVPSGTAGIGGQPYLVEAAASAPIPDDVETVIGSGAAGSAAGGGKSVGSGGHPASGGRNSGGSAGHPASGGRPPLGAGGALDSVGGAGGGGPTTGVGGRRPDPLGSGGLASGTGGRPPIGSGGRSIVFKPSPSATPKQKLPVTPKPLKPPPDPPK